MSMSVYLFLNKIDKKIIDLFISLHSLLYKHIPIKETLDKIKNIKLILNISNIIKNMVNYVSLMFPNLYKLLNDISNVLKSNKKFILHFLRIYLYIIIIMYGFVFLFITISFLIDSKWLLFVSKCLLQIYWITTYPIKKIKFLIKYFFIWPFKILKLIANIIIFFKNIISELIRPYKNNINTKNECSGEEKEEQKEFEKKIKSDHGLSPEYGRSSFLDPTEHSLNCMKQKVLLAYQIPKTWAKIKNAAQFASTAMDFDQKNTNKVYSKLYTNFKNEIKQERKDIKIKIDVLRIIKDKNTIEI